MRKALRISKSDSERDDNQEQLYNFLSANDRPLICRSESLKCKVYKNSSYVGIADLVTNNNDGRSIDLFLQNTDFDDDISTDFCTRFEPMEYTNNCLEIGCYKKSNRAKEYIITLEPTR
ncbi:hypothetical protein [Clostridium beijerinckii]|uniref:Uncharacterized protein n=1 Tax=Clostridium beijerinckii TaxID=1520 RepID=A0AAW3W141_CLOBE|nr:hypothetical protein [Clostridium beijerinckii]MBC2455643.1 hypothetical protein [Clostridium beijerinckii]MBC2473120.1 hypothetical protein [Clostridium beijerinckii]NOV62376.1 hypothetical protein [Clostridium beijerinckii]NOV68127.1 hypothetical protein [Clostridium beijerinckii]NOW30428.1 hypothetical protein [Clostridium beijerinckii]